MPTVKNVGEPCAGEPHARFDGGREETRPVDSTRAAEAPPVYPTTPNSDGGTAPEPSACSLAASAASLVLRHIDGRVPCRAWWASIGIARFSGARRCQAPSKTVG